MGIFGTIYRYELKKLFQKSYLTALLALMTAGTLFLNLRPLFETREVVYLDESGVLVQEQISRYQEILLERRFAKAFAGKLLDNETAAGMRADNARYQEDFQTSEPDQRCILLNDYLVFQTLYRLGINPLTDSTDCLADFARQIMETRQEDEYEAQLLTAAERSYWQDQRSRIVFPFTLAYAEGYSGILDKAYWLNLMSLLFILISLCGSFSDDTAYQTRPLLAVTRFGRRRLMLARLAAGESLACGTVLLLFGLTASIQFFVHGTDGSQASLQSLSFVLSASSRPLTAGQAVLLVLGMSLLLAVFAGTVSMLLSALFGRAVPALALPLGLLLLSLVFETSFYSYDRLRSQLWSCLPFQRLSESFFLDMRLVSIGTLTLDCIPISLLLYGGLTGIALAAWGVTCRLRTIDRK